ncbi:Pimeloyl-ACP methyl ester carboxylesterase [Pseudonocardia thermophila]|uniref:Pimeloyl-ACP methyl ester carboxylesterase n=1 Tax=Pseudonocardia thermophila TaxID=1848 RepID=A0A1M7BBW4_PSETH|nr:alpha/beta hydrolase [Pseudonocardia thermophila]SHL52424.1 Pimeloyl-ACP methyl ester carboxylesterase [Pseudonocardia thermophila]
MDAAVPARTMSVRAPDGVRLHVTDTGEGPPVLFLHEFAGDHRSWARQVRELGRDFRCLTYAARGYIPSDVPSVASAYSWQQAVADAVSVLDALGLESAHLVGLSMGGYTALQVGLHHRDRVRSIMAVSVGSGSDPATRDAYLAETRHVADYLRSHGAAFVGERMAGGPSRVQLAARDWEAWQEMVDQFAEHSVDGLVHTILEVQGRRPALHDLTEGLSGLRVPLFVVTGDEDEACLSTGLLLKRTVPRCGWQVLPNTGHVPNLEDPSRFNDLVRQFVVCVEAGTWPERDPRSRAVLQFDLDRIDADAH